MNDVLLQTSGNYDENSIILFIPASFFFPVTFTLQFREWGCYCFCFLQINHKKRKLKETILCCDFETMINVHLFNFPTLQSWFITPSVISDHFHLWIKPLMMKLSQSSSEGGADANSVSVAQTLNPGPNNPSRSRISCCNITSFPSHAS